MSLRILNPLLSEMCKMPPATGMVGLNISCSQQVKCIKRDLFGAANSNNSEDTDILYREELKRSQNEANKKWGFDFCKGVPLAGNSHFTWERVSCREYNYAPPQYTLIRAAHVRPTLPAEDTEMDVRLDERAERENFMLLESSQTTNNTTDTDSCDDSQDDEARTSVVFKMPQVVVPDDTAHCTHTDAVSRNRRNSAINKMTVTLRKRQPKITEYMKERKRLIQTPKKKTPNKRMRTSSGSSITTGSSTSSSSGSSRTRLEL